MGRTICPKCGKETLYCSYKGDVGGVGAFEDEYEAYCTSCGYQETMIVWGGSLLWENWPTRCPFCGKIWCGKYENEEKDK